MKAGNMIGQYKSHKGKGICLDCRAMCHNRDDWEIGTCSIDGKKINHINNHIPCDHWVCPRWRYGKDPVEEPDEYEWADGSDYSSEYDYLVYGTEYGNY